ncbi:MAG: IMPACT family member YigZ [Formosa sp. Hel3_A1_48]|nr:MAG: IMPACT family member YigZ [Formosa sp. Hel3_A1_48]
MDEKTLEFQTIDRASNPVLYKDKGSKFFAYAFPIINESDVKRFITILKEKHKTAGHFCYAYRFGASGSVFKVSDDGEPKNSAGMPILGQLQARNLTNTLLVVVRYFGGTKLGIGGLISAYRTAAKYCLDDSEITTLYIKKTIIVRFSYDALSHVMRIIKTYNLKIIEQHQELDCWLKILVKKRDLEVVKSAFKTHYKIELEILND